MKTLNSSPVSSSLWCFLLILLWACTIAAGLVNQEFDEPQATTPGHYLTTNTVLHNFGHGYNMSKIACGVKNDTDCEAKYCIICDHLLLPTMKCYSELLNYYCYTPFVESMDLLNNTDWCIWTNVRSPYNHFTRCTEDVAECLVIPWPNALAEQNFVNIHSMFFRDCPTEELSDPAPSIVFALVMTPICLIPVMVILVVLKTKNGDGRS